MFIIKTIPNGIFWISSQNDAKPSNAPATSEFRVTLQNSRFDGFKSDEQGEHQLSLLCDDCFETEGGGYVARRQNRRVYPKGGDNQEQFRVQGSGFRVQGLKKAEGRSWKVEFSLLEKGVFPSDFQFLAYKIP
ncbi:MAG: hypothetical protein K1Y36_23710 [Blastocatellia bacterium]|nr:hypothetical protein [Blastocatellia bacterium]